MEMIFFLIMCDATQQIRHLWQGEQRGQAEQYHRLPPAVLLAHEEQVEKRQRGQQQRGEVMGVEQPGRAQHQEGPGAEVLA